MQFVSEGGQEENCGILVLPWEGWDDWKCNVNPTDPIQCACEKAGSVYLKLRGKCPASDLDTYWTAQTERGRYFLHGIESSVIVFDDGTRTWSLKATKNNHETSASSDSSYHSFLLGKSNWNLMDDLSIIIFSHNINS